MPDQKAKHTNRLIRARSPYLQQHAHNPVDWHSWDEEALQAAHEEDKAILLSIGYSACHWCHVMEHESFENEEIANLMNEHFINIKVDREERPDLDAIYMNFVQMTTGSGGWPLTVFLTPDLVPFYGGTYFPPEDYYGRPGFKRLLQVMADTYQNRRPEIEKSREGIIQRLSQASQWGQGEAELKKALLDEAYSALLSQFDHHHGGFGEAPKFPAAMALSFLLRYQSRAEPQTVLSMVKLSLDEMAHGGIYDQLGGGFHRYSVDERWLVPHFEKMLYDNALLSRVYLEAYQVTGDPYYREIVEETLGWVEREMQDEAGGFYSAQDADSEGEEGKFYVWTVEEMEALLGKEEAQIFGDYFDVSSGGNFEGKNILHHRRELKPFAESLGLSPEDLKQRLDGGRQRLFRQRETRVRPGLDDKVLAAWNGMMLTAFADAAFVLKDQNLLQTAVHNAEFLASEMLAEGRLFRSWKDGKAHLNAYLEDYALVIEGWLATYQSTGDAAWLEKADQLMEQQLELFWDPEQDSFYFTSRDHEELLVRHREFMDNATPSGNSVSCLNLLKLAVLLGKPEYRDRAGRMLQRVARILPQYPSAFGYWLQAADFFFGPVVEIAAVGSPAQRDDLLQAVRDRFLPSKVVTMAEKVDLELSQKIPLLQGKTAGASQAMLYICENYSCREPATTSAEVRHELTRIQETRIHTDPGNTD